MKRITSLIQIGRYEFTSVTDIKINSSYENLTDTATITIPRKLSFEGKLLSGDEGLFKSGDAVKIHLGYDFKNKLVFEGFVRSVKPGTPLEISCEDAMFALKKGATSKSWKSVNLQSLLKETITGFPIRCDVEATLGKFRMQNATPAQVLNELRQTYAIKSFFRNGTLYVGLAFWRELQNPVPPKFIFSGVDGNIIGHDLEYQDANDVKIKVRAISMNPNNTKTEVILGDDDGGERTLTYYDKSAKELKEAAERDLQRFKFSGFNGKFKTYGEPLVKHGDKIELIDPKISDRNGFYIVKSVETTFGRNGYKQEIALEAKV